MTDQSLILGIETSCDETAASVVRAGRHVMSNVIASQYDLHEKFGGVVPEIASRAHIERINPVIQQALDQAQTTFDQLDAISVGNRPGLIGSLLVGVAAAKTLAWSLNKPLIGIDHLHAHLYAGALNNQPIKYPAIGLVVSGGHTSIYLMHSPLDTQLLGKTIDDALGEAYDKVASILNLPFPGGPALDKLAQSGNPNAVNFPRTLLAPQSLDFSYSGIKTSVLYHVKGHPQRRNKTHSFPRSASSLTDQQKADIAASFQQAAIDVVITKLSRTLAYLIQSDSPHTTVTAPKSLIIGGGVSANSLLRLRTIDFAKQNNLDIRLPEMPYCMDNAAMVAGLAHHHYLNQRFDDLTLQATATSRL